MLSSKVFTYLFWGFYVMFFVSIIKEPNFLDISYFIVLSLMLLRMKFVKDTEE